MAKIAHVVIFFFLLFPASEVNIVQNTKPKADAESNTGERARDVSFSLRYELFIAGVLSSFQFPVTFQLIMNTVCIKKKKNNTKFQCIDQNIYSIAAMMHKMICIRR